MMDYHSLNKELKRSAARLEEQESLPRGRADDFKYQILGIFNDVHDETGYQMWGLKTVIDYDRGLGQVNIGYAESVDTRPARDFGVRLLANADEYATTVHMVPLDADVNAVSDEDQIMRFPYVVFSADGGDYPQNLKMLVGMVRQAAKGK